MSENLENNDLLSKWLAGDLTEEERVQLEKEGNLDDLKFVVDDVATWTLKSLDIDGGLEKLKMRRKVPAPKAKVISFSPWMKVAAAVSLIIVSYFGWNLYFNTQVEIITGLAEVHEATLPDESIIKLDALSKVTYSKKTWDEQRVLDLSGQAYFDVVTGGSFIVNTPSGSVTVLGTEFNIRVEGDLFMVECYEGSVLVKSAQKEEILKPGEGVSLINGSLKRNIHNDPSPDWTGGFSEYDQVVLSQVIKDLKKYYPIEITLPSNYATLEFTGQVTHNNLDKALRTVSQTMEINYSVNADGKVVFE